MREYTFSYWFGSAYGWWRWMDVIWMEETAGWSRDYSTARLPDSQARRGQGRFVTDPAPPPLFYRPGIASRRAYFIRMYSRGYRHQGLRARLAEVSFGSTH